MKIIITAAKIIALITLSVVGAVFSGLGLSELTTIVGEPIEVSSDSEPKTVLATAEPKQIGPMEVSSGGELEPVLEMEAPRQTEPFTEDTKVILDSST